jgi:hypothetical protein
MKFSECPPSSEWERFPIGAESPVYVWTWFKPESAPTALCLQIPEESLRDAQNVSLTLKSVLHEFGISPYDVAAGSLYGIPFEVSRREWSILESPLRPPDAGFDPTITIWVKPQSSADRVEAHSVGDEVRAEPETGPAESHSLSPELLARLNFSWNASIQLENSLFLLRQQFNAMLMRINSLNRELSADEARCADNLDRRDWQSCRQWMRDVLACLMRSIKVHDVTRSQFAEKRRCLETTYFQYIMPGRTFDGIEQIEQEFQAYHAGLQSLLTAMNSVRDPGWEESERKIRHTLSRIAVKMRSDKSRR